MPEAIPEEEVWIREQGLAGQLVRTAPPSPDYVCHDWVFTDGRYSLAGSPVEAILEDNGYAEVGRPRAGDLAVYRHGSGGSAIHTGVVRAAEEGGAVRVESKWGWRSRFLHPADVYCHPEAVCSFFRSTRRGHLLLGLDGSPAPGRETVLTLPAVVGLPLH
jgi:hypothetical protein